LILIVEDEPSIGELLLEILSDEGYRVEWRPDAESGLQSARDFRPDLVLLNLALPGMSGQEALRLLKADPATASLPVVVLSALTARLTPAEREQVVGVLDKPFELSQLLVLVSSSLRRVG
jgi:DNA-binding response OmpR family regulator